MKDRIEEGKNELVLRTENVPFLQGYVQAMIDFSEFGMEDVPDAS
jgi:hypothetical protein